MSNEPKFGSFEWVKRVMNLPAPVLAEPTSCRKASSDEARENTANQEEGKRPHFRGGQNPYHPKASLDTAAAAPSTLCEVGTGSDKPESANAGGGPQSKPSNPFPTEPYPQFEHWNRTTEPN